MPTLDERALAEDGGADAHNGRAFGDGELHIASHAHRQFQAAFGSRRLGRKDQIARLAQMREAFANRGLIVDMRANRHQALQFEAIQRAYLLCDADGVRRIAT